MVVGILLSVEASTVSKLDHRPTSLARAGWVVGDAWEGGGGSVRYGIGFGRLGWLGLTLGWLGLVWFGFSLPWFAWPCLALPHFALPARTGVLALAGLT